MADPLAARAKQLRNIEAKTGQSFAQLCALISTSGLAKVGEQRTMLMQALGLSFGDANVLALIQLNSTAKLTAAMNAEPAKAQTSLFIT